MASWIDGGKDFTFSPLPGMNTPPPAYPTYNSAGAPAAAASADPLADAEKEQDKESQHGFAANMLSGGGAGAASNRGLFSSVFGSNATSIARTVLLGS